MAHREHSKATYFFRRVENDRRETGRHFGVETNLDTLQKNKEEREKRKIVSSAAEKLKKEQGRKRRAKTTSC